MSFKPGDILHFDEYIFTDTGEIRKHFALALAPEDATKWQSSIYCCVITSKEPKRWGYFLKKDNYPCFSRDSYICLNRKDLVPKCGLSPRPQPRGELNTPDMKSVFKELKNSLYIIKDQASEPFIRGAIIMNWKKALGLINI